MAEAVRLDHAVATLRGRHDAVVMLTASDWFLEMRSNRYHYAKRWSAVLPVVFVQPDELGTQCVWENTELPGVRVLHVPKKHGTAQHQVLDAALREAGVRSPLLWVYNFFFSDYVAQRRASTVVYHATEDYLNGDFMAPEDLAEAQAHFPTLLRHTNLVVAVSDGVKESYCSRGIYDGPALTLPNGCDYAFWREGLAKAERTPKLALYQGGIHRKVDFALMEEVARLLPDWTFAFCGSTDPKESAWKNLKALPNVRYLGTLSAEEVRAWSHKASVGIIPFVQNDWIVKRSWPLKAFEFLAAGLPVVSTPVRSLEQFPEVFSFATDAKTFAAGIERSAQLLADASHSQLRDTAAKAQDYDGRFAQLCLSLGTLTPMAPETQKLRIAFLYDPDSMHVAAIDTHLREFLRFSRHEVVYVAASRRAKAPELAAFDAVVVHYSVRINVPGHMSPHLEKALRGYRGLKALFIQDEYDTTETARKAIERLALDVVYTCVPERYTALVYPPARFPRTTFVSTITGYAPEPSALWDKRRSFDERAWIIGYRGRDLPYWYGDLGQEKLFIGTQMRAQCDQRGVRCNIEWASDKRIYGGAWYEFIDQCRWMLGTESGSNVFDDDGQISQQVQAALTENPNLSYAEAKARFPKLQDGAVRMNQVSPKLFEAVERGTGLILFEGDYSGIFRANEHYLPLRKDFSNVEEVLRRAQDKTTFEEMTARAYRDIVESHRYSAKNFVESFDTLVEARVKTPRTVTASEALAMPAPLPRVQLEQLYQRLGVAEDTSVSLAFALRRGLFVALRETGRGLSAALAFALAPRSLRNRRVWRTRIDVGLRKGYVLVRTFLAGQPT